MEHEPRRTPSESAVVDCALAMRARAPCGWGLCACDVGVTPRNGTPEAQQTGNIVETHEPDESPVTRHEQRLARPLRPPTEDRMVTVTSCTLSSVGTGSNSTSRRARMIPDRCGEIPHASATSFEDQRRISLRVGLVGAIRLLME